MKKLLLASAALAALIAGGPAGAADMPAYRAPPPVAPYYYNWSGFYVGGFVGSTWGKSDWSLVDLIVGANTNTRLAGALAGADVGYNIQVGALVFGVEGDYFWSNATGAALCTFANTFTCHSELNRVGTFTGRLGYAWDNILVFVKGGGAWGSTGLTTTSNATGQPFRTGNDTRGGWTSGAGFEIGFTPNWSGKVEYDYMDFGTHRVTTNFVGSAIPSTVDTHVQAHAVKVGVNYHFSSGPVYAKY